MLSLVRKFISAFIPVKPGQVKVDPNSGNYETEQMLKFPPGSKVISVSNEDEPYRIGVIQRYEPITLAKQMTPIVKFDGDDEEFLIMSHLEPHSEELCSMLDQLNNIEQWNYCVCRHCQIKEKNGTTARTFECSCDNCVKSKESKDGNKNT